MVSTIVNNELHWIFRTNHSEHDFGIDGYIDIVTESGSVTGQSFAVQIKAGGSFFNQETPNGYTFYGEGKHLNYYSNHQLPVLIIICNLVTRTCYWQDFDPPRIETTTKNWKLNILKRNTLARENKEKLISILPEIIDVRDDLSQQRMMNEEFKNADRIHFTVSHKEIMHTDISKIKAFFSRLAANDDLYRKSQGKVEVYIDGFNNDKRELYEVKEVKKWFKKANKKVDGWFYFLNTDEPSDSFLLFIFCNCIASAKINNSTRMTGYEAVKLMKLGAEIPKDQIALRGSDVANLFRRNLIRLNYIADYLGMTEEEVDTISSNIENMLKVNAILPTDVFEL